MSWAEVVGAGWCSWAGRSSWAREFAQEVQRALAVRAEMRFRLGEFGGRGFGGLAEELADLGSGFFCGAGLEAVVADAAKALRQDVQAPAAEELMRVKVEGVGFFGAAAGPAESNVALVIVAEDTLGTDGAAVEVSREVADGGFSSACGLELDVPLGSRDEGAVLVGGELLVEVGVIGFEALMDKAAEAGSEWLEVDEELIGLFGVDEGFGFAVVGDGGDDGMNVGMESGAAVPGVEHRSKAELEMVG